MRSLRTVATAATLLALTVSLAGCGEDEDGDAGEPVTETVTESAAPTSSAPTTSATASTTDGSVTPMDPTASSDVTQEQAEAALLTPEEVGTDFVLGAYTDSDDPLPCDPGGTPLDVQVPPGVTGGTQIEHSSGEAALIEEIAIYDSEEEAAQAFGIGTAGLSCTDGTLPDGTAITLDAAQDVTADVNTSGLGTTTAWGFSTDEIEGVFVATLAGRVVLSTSFQSLTGADTSSLPDPIDVQATAFAKALAN